MLQHNWYAVLSVPSGATEKEIKTAYRKLAMQFHPDKNPGNEKAAKKFGLIKEAYEILHNSKSRAAFDRKIHASTSGNYTTNYHSVSELLTAVKRTSETYRLENMFFINRNQLTAECQELIDAFNRQVLITETDRSETEAFITELIKCTGFITYRQTVQVMDSCTPFMGNDPDLSITVKKYLAQRRLTYLWDKYKIVFAIITGLLITLLIFLS